MLQIDQVSVRYGEATAVRKVRIIMPSPYGN